MIETTMKLVDSTGQGIVPVYEIGIDDGPDGLFAPRYGRGGFGLHWPPAWEFGVPGSRAIAGP